MLPPSCTEPHGLSLTGRTPHVFVAFCLSSSCSPLPVYFTPSPFYSNTIQRNLLPFSRLSKGCMLWRKTNVQIQRNSNTYSCLYELHKPSFVFLATLLVSSDAPVSCSFRSSRVLFLLAAAEEIIKVWEKERKKSGQRGERTCSQLWSQCAVRRGAC